MPRKCPRDGLGASPGTSKTSRPDLCVSGPEKGVITKGVFSLEESLESLKSLDSLENGRTLLYFPQSGDSLKSLESLDSLESLENGLFWKDPFSKRPPFPNPSVLLHRLDRMSAGQTGHFHGTNETRPWDGCGPEIGRVTLNFFMFTGLFASQSVELGRVKHESLQNLW